MEYRKLNKSANGGEKLFPLVSWILLSVLLVTGCKKSERCEESVDKFKLWVMDFQQFISHTYYGRFYGELVDSDFNYENIFSEISSSKGKKFIEIHLYPERIYNLGSSKNICGSDGVGEKLKSNILEHDKGLREKITEEPEKNGLDEICAMLFIDKGVDWGLFVDAVTTIVELKVDDLVLVFEGEDVPVDPPKTVLAKKLFRAKQKSTKRAKKEDKMYIRRSFARLGKYFSECPDLESSFERAGLFDPIERSWWISTKLPKIIRRCDCEPPVERVKSVLWHYYYWGKSRVGLRVKLCLEPCSKCNIVALHNDVPWATAAKVVMKEHASSPERPFCFKSIEDSEEKSRGRATGEPKVRH